MDLPGSMRTLPGIFREMAQEMAKNAQFSCRFGLSFF